MNTLKEKAVLIGKLRILASKLNKLGREINKMGFSTDPDLNTKYWKMIDKYGSYKKEALALRKEYNKLFYNKK